MNGFYKIYTNDDEGVLAMTRKIYNTDNSFNHYQNLHYLFDNLGSVAAITDDSGKPVQYYQYDPYGQITNTETDPVNSLTFVGRYYGQKDWDTGFVYFWHRWYDSGDGRWISRDPIGVKGGINVYNYTGENPVNRLDSKGLCYAECNKKIKQCMIDTGTNAVKNYIGSVLGDAILKAGGCMAVAGLTCSKTGPAFPECFTAAFTICTLYTGWLANTIVGTIFDVVDIGFEINNCNIEYNNCKINKDREVLIKK